MKKIFSLLVVVFLFSCAGTYKPIYPKALAYPSQSNVSGVSYSYRYNVLTDTGNKKYANKEDKKGIKLIAIKIENNTDRVINFKRDIDVYMGSRVIFPMEPELIKSTIKQPAPLYLLWSLLWVTIYNCDGNDCNVTPIPVGLGIGLINVGIAGSANRNFLDELNYYNILEKDIEPGETVYGLMGLSTDISAPITLQLK